MTVYCVYVLVAFLLWPGETIETQTEVESAAMTREQCHAVKHPFFHLMHADPGFEGGTVCVGDNCATFSKRQP